MIGGISPNGNQAFQSGNSVARERTDVARAPAAAPEKNSEAIRRDLASERQQTRPTQVIDADVLDRRIEARRAAEDVRLERFRADELPLATSQALSTFTDVASRGDGSDTGLAGIDILV